MTALDVFWVGLGGGLGSLLRWWIGLRVGQFYKGSFPLGTFLINVSGGVLQGSCRVSRVFKLLFSLPAAPSLG